MNIVYGVHGQSDLIEVKVQSDIRTEASSSVGSVTTTMVPVKRKPFIDFYESIIKRDKDSKAIPTFSLPR